MEYLTIDQLISHCEKQLKRLPPDSPMYQEHVSTKLYLEMLRCYASNGPVSEFQRLIFEERRKQYEKNCSE